MTAATTASSRANGCKCSARQVMPIQLRCHAGILVAITMAVICAGAIPTNNAGGRWMLSILPLRPSKAVVGLSSQSSLSIKMTCLLLHKLVLTCTFRYHMFLAPIHKTYTSAMLYCTSWHPFCALQMKLVNARACQTAKATSADASAAAATLQACVLSVNKEVQTPPCNQTYTVVNMQHHLLHDVPYG